MKQLFDIPILFIIFNRPEVTKIVFDEIKKISPKKLYIAADGPRQNVIDDEKKCFQTRAIVNEINWDCGLKMLFREKNLGCKKAVSSAIDWFFTNEEEGIIIEDDCLPNHFFWGFCKELLARYRDDERIMHIGGCNFLNDGLKIMESYYFSRAVHIWGWATWRRAWRYYDVDMKLLPEFERKNMVKCIYEDKKQQEWTIKELNMVYDGKINTWDAQWAFTVWSQNGLSIIPSKNLVTNIGFNTDATHGDSSIDPKSIQKTFDLNIASHPSILLPNFEADNYVAKHHRMTIKKRIVNKIRRLLKNGL